MPSSKILEFFNKNFLILFDDIKIHLWATITKTTYPMRTTNHFVKSFTGWKTILCFVFPSEKMKKKATEKKVFTAREELNSSKVANDLEFI